MANEKNTVPVLDTDNRFLSYTNPAKARILIKQGKATVFCKTPFMLKLRGENEGKSKMKLGMTGNMITSFVKYFSEEHDVYVQNISNTQISLCFKTRNGDDIPVTIPKTRRPIQLTNFAPFDSIKDSQDFRKIMNRMPPVLRLMTEEEFVSYYEGVAAQNNSTADAEYQKAVELQSSLMNKVKPSTAVVRAELEQMKEDKMDALSKPATINPRVIGLCADADKDFGPGRISSEDFIEQLEMLSSDLTVDDWEFVMSKGAYRAVKKFAGTMLDKLTGSSEESADPASE